MLVERRLFRLKAIRNTCSSLLLPRLSVALQARMVGLFALKLTRDALTG